MAIALITHVACLRPDTGDGHPECADRLSAVLDALNIERFPDLLRIEAGWASPTDLMRVHDRAYVERILELQPAAGEIVPLDLDTMVSSHTIEAALRACGGAMDAVDLVMNGGATSAFVAVRPPGHHAEPARAMGFCLFNSVAVAACHAGTMGPETGRRCRLRCASR